jgi:oligoendopeptidase F
VTFFTSFASYVSSAQDKGSVQTVDSSSPAQHSLPEWDLTHLYAGIDSQDFHEDANRTRTEARRFAETYSGKLATLCEHADAGERLFDAIRHYEALEDLMGRLMAFASLIYASNTVDPAHAKFYGDTQSLMTELGAQLLFFELELNRLEDDRLDALAAQAPLQAYRPWLNDIRKNRPHQLEDALETLFLEKAMTGRSAWNRLFDETIASLRFSFRSETFPLEKILNQLQEPQEDIRREAAQEISRVFREKLSLFTLITNTLAKDKDISDRWRKFEDIADSRHLSNRVEREVVDALVSAVRAAYPRVSHRYYALKAKWFGKESLNFWDRNAPLPQGPFRSIPWQEARQMVLDAYAGFSPNMAQIAGRFFEENWIDAALRPGKSPGAFAHPTVPSAHPYVLINYQGKPRDVMTLAHELGHGVHQVLASHNGALMAPTPLTLAETASVFGEMLTFRRLLSQTTDPLQRKALLAGKVEDMINTVVRQIAFYSFERLVHSERRNGELTAERINTLWLQVQRESLGPAITLNDGYEVYWAYIPHFIHSPFYVYAYAFGDCLVNSLYGVYQNAQDGFVERYFALLSAGGTRHHSELLAPFGLDARDPAFWQIGLGMIEEMIVELEKM